MEGKRISNNEVVKILEEILAAMEIKSANSFRIRAYQNAVSILDNLTVSIYDLWENKKLQEIPGVGPGIAAHLNELFSTGQVAEFEQAKEDLPEGMFEFLELRGVGAKRAFKLASAFKINSRENARERLLEAGEAGKIRNLEGFGEKTEEKIIDAIKEQKKSKNEKQRMLLTHAEQIVERIKEHMVKCKEVKEVVACGSFRRRNPTVGDLDIPISTTNPEKAIKHFLKFDEILEVVNQGEKKATVILKNDIQVDIYMSTPEAFGSMLQYFTGSKQHNILLRTYALSKGMSLSEYGIKKGGKLKEYANEEDFYKELGLPCIVPELRNGNYEIEAAKENKFPKLITPEDIKGDIHVHTELSDGVNTIEEMVEKAKALGYEYVGITDHAPSVSSRGMGTVLKMVSDTRKKIEEINESQKDIKVLFGYEVNILVDETLGLPDDILKDLDIVIAGIHAAFDQDKGKITARYLAALNNPYVDVLSHPAGRMINERDGTDPDWRKVFDAARESNKILEINAQPDRLDLPDDLIKEAIEWGVKLIINSDAHALEQMDFMKYGVFNARRGWAESKDIVNTLPYKEFVKELGIG
ncbi:MAG: DNA polymerase/3'-5' exonuclease PolX [Patescibacteria group bacterium]